MKTFAHEKAATTAVRQGSAARAAVDVASPAHDFIGDFTGMLVRKAGCACGGGCPTCQSQTGNLKISQPTDAAEIEADQTAHRVMRMASADSTSSGHPEHGLYEEEEDGSGRAFEIQRQCAAGGDEDPPDEEFLGVQRRATGGKAGTARISHHALTSGGEPMSASVRAYFEPRFGRELSSVRLHTGEHAAQTASSLGAQAFTYGSHVWLGRGQRAEANELMAHELAHVVQQTSPAKRAAAPAAGRGAAPALSPIARSIQRTACQDATRLHAERAGRPVPEEAAPTVDETAAADERWAAAATAIDYAATVLESPVGRGILSMLPGPVGMLGGSESASSLRLVSAVLPEIRSVWDLLSHPVRLMARVRAFVDAQLPGVPEIVRARLAAETFAVLRDSRHMVAIGLAVGDAVAELLANWTTPFVTAWNTFISPFDIDAEMADLACIQERHAAGEIDSFEAYTAVYGWVVGWVNRYSVYVTIALVVGGGVVGAAGGTAGGGTVGAAAGGVGAAPGGAVGGGGGFAAGAGSGWAIAETLGVGLLAANAVHMLLDVAAAIARLQENDRAVDADAAAGRTPSAEELERRQRQEDQAYSSIAQVIVNLGIMGTLVLLGTFGPQFARVAVAGLSRRYPSLGRYLVSIGARIERSSIGQTVREVEAGRAAMRERLRGGSTRTDSERRSDSDGETRRDSDSETGRDTDTETRTDADTGTRADADAETRSDADADADADTGTGTESDAHPGREGDVAAPRADDAESLAGPEPDSARAPETEAPRTAEPEAPRAAEPAEPETLTGAEPEATPAVESGAAPAAEPEGPLAAEPEQSNAAGPAPQPAPLPPAATPPVRALDPDIEVRIDRALELSRRSSPYRGRLRALRQRLDVALRVLRDRRRTTITPQGVAMVEDEFEMLMDDIARSCEEAGDTEVAEALRGGPRSITSADIVEELGELTEGTPGAAVDPSEPGGSLGEPDPDLPEATTDPTSGATGRAARSALRRAAGPAPAGWQNHHLIPLELREHEAVYYYERMVRGVDNPRATASIGARAVDQPTNNLPMPSTPAAAGTSGVTIHRGSHPLYTDWMEGRLDALWAERDTLTLDQFARRFEDIIGNAEIMLDSGAWGPTMQPPRR